MKKGKILIMTLLIIGLIGISISTFASRNLLEYTEDGKVIIYAGEEVPEGIEEGTPMVLAVPNTPQMSPDEFQQKEKEEFKKAHSDLQNIVIEDKSSTLSVQEEQEKHEEPAFMEVLYKYYGKEKIENIYSEIDKELSGGYYSNEPELLTNTQRKIVEMSIEIINSNEITNEEKEILKEELKEVASKIADTDIIEKINSL